MITILPRAKSLWCTAALLLLGTAMALPAAAQQLHGVSIFKGCNQTKVGDPSVCIIRFANDDDFGDSINLTEVYDIVQAFGGDVRVPAVGNLPIIAVDAGVTCTPGGGPINLEFPCELPGALNGSNLGVTVMAEYTPTAQDPNPLPDQAQYVFFDLCDAPGTSNCNPAQANATFNAQTTFFEPAISVDKSGPAVAKAGDTVSYSVSFANNSSANTPALTCTASDDRAGNLGPITPGVPIVYDFAIPAEAPAGGFDNTATVTCNIAGFQNQVSDSDTHTVQVFTPSIEVIKSGPTVAKAGDTVTYSVTVNNTSSAGTPALSCTADDSLVGSLGAIAANGVPVNYDYAIPADAVGTIQNTVTVTCGVAGFANEVFDSDSHDIELFTPAISVDKSGPEVSKAGDTVSYTVLLSNDSSANTPALSCTADDSLVGPLGAIVPGVPLNYDYAIPADAVGTIDNTVSVTCSVAGFQNTVEASDSHSVQLLEPAVSLSKVCRPDPVHVGETLTWEITVENTGDTALDCVVNDPTAGIVDEPFLGLAPGATDFVTADREMLPEDEGVISNTASVSCTLTGGTLPNVLTGEASADCEVLPDEEFPPDAICRTPGFWGTHAGTEKKNSSNLTQIVIDAAGGSLQICGKTIDNTNVGDVMSALEAICVSPEGESRLQLFRHLTSMALNCVVTGGGADCSGVGGGVDTLYADADAACASDAADLGDFIAPVDCFNNGGGWIEDQAFCSFGTFSDGSFCSSPDEVKIIDGVPETCSAYENNCHERELDESDVFVGVSPLPGPAGSSKGCNAATSNSTLVLP